MIEQAKFTYSLLGKALEKKQKQLMIKEETSRSFKSLKTSCSIINLRYNS